VPQPQKYSFIDLFSGGGGMSFGFAAHPAFELRAAFDAEFGKPSSGMSSLGCNQTYKLNLRLAPTAMDLSAATDADIEAVRRDVLGGARLDVLSACPPCTGFSRANPDNHLEDDHRNSHVVRTADWVRILQPRVLVMENARELLNGNFSHHFDQLRSELEALGYDVHAEVHMLSEFGVPQRRERALVVATDLPGGARGLRALWSGHEVDEGAVTPRRAIAHLPSMKAGKRHPDDRCHVSPSMTAPLIARSRAIPHDGGSWIDLLDHPDADTLMTPAMKRYVKKGKLGSHPDVYGRMAWDRPAVTIKRECSHVGNGRYTHPEQDRLCTVRELAILQGFPASYRFGGGSLSNMYRHIGDAVPPLISFQLAHVVHWMITGERPALEDCVLPDTSLRAEDIRVRPVAPVAPPDPQLPLHL